VGEALRLKLPAAERAYAEALRAPTVLAATRKLREAVGHDPAPRRALELLASLLFLQGQLGEAREAVVQLQAAAPRSLSGLIVRALLLVHDGDLKEAEKLCDRLVPVYGEEGTKLYRELIQLAALFTAEDFLWGETNPQKTADLGARITTFFPRLTRLQEGTKHGAAAGWNDFVLLRLPCVQSLTATLGLPRLWDFRNLPDLLANPGDLPEALRRLSQGWPDGYFHYLRAVFLRVQGKRDEAEAALLQALATPSFLRIERRARFELLRTRWEGLEGLAGPQRWELENLARGDLRRFLALGGERPVWADSWLWQIARDLREPEVALASARDWVRRSPDSVDALAAQWTVERDAGAFAAAADTARLQVQLDPKQQSHPNRVGIAEYDRRYYRPALGGYLDALRLDPDNQTVRGNLNRLEQAVRQQGMVHALVLAKLRLAEPLVQAPRGQHAEALALAARLTPEDAGGDALLALACVQALASAAARCDAALAEGRRTALAEQYARDALATLKKARDAGYFRDPFRVRLLTSEDDLAPLTDRADYQAFVAGLPRP
jgi:hypothetical protein